MRLTYAIGDIHGRRDLLSILLRKIEEHADGRPHAMIFLGDYIDRGPDSAAVIETLRRLQAERPHEVICLKGNHEAMLLEVLDTPSLASWWIRNGGDAALASYGAASPNSIPADVQAWLKDLPTLHEDERRYFVHAGLRPGLALEDQTEHDMLWIREAFLDFDRDFGKHVVHGHTPQRSGQPEERPFRTNLDTGAVFTGVLTAGVFSDEQGPAIGFLQTGRPSLRDTP